MNDTKQIDRVQVRIRNVWHNAVVKQSAIKYVVVILDNGQEAIVKPRDVKWS